MLAWISTSGWRIDFPLYCNTDWAAVTIFETERSGLALSMSVAPFCVCQTKILWQSWEELDGAGLCLTYSGLMQERDWIPCGFCCAPAWMNLRMIAAFGTAFSELRAWPYRFWGTGCRWSSSTWRTARYIGAAAHRASSMRSGGRFSCATARPLSAWS